MRALARSLLALSLAACGGACPEPAAPRPCPAEPQPPSSGPAGADERGSMDGTWLLGEPGDDVEVLLELSGDEGSARALDGSGEYRVRVVRRDDGPWRLEATADRRETERVYWIPQGPGRALAFPAGDDDLLLAVRVGPVPPPLRGEWIIRKPGDDRSMRLSLDAERVRITRDGETAGGPAHGIEAPGETVVLALADVLHGGDELRLIHFHPVGDGSYLAREPTEDDFVVIHRPGAPPDWLDEPPAGRPRSQAAEERPATGRPR